MLPRHIIACILVFCKSKIEFFRVSLRFQPVPFVLLPIFELLQMEDSKRIFEIISRQTGALPVVAKADSTELHSLPRALLSSDYLNLVRVSDDVWR